MKMLFAWFSVLLYLLSACQSSATLPSPPSVAPTSAILPMPALATPEMPLESTPAAAAAASEAIPMTGGQIVTSAGQITGVWLIDHPDFRPGYMILREDGAIIFSPNTNGTHGQSANFKVENGQFEYNSPICDSPAKFNLQIDSMAGQPDRLIFTPIDDGCGGFPTRVLSQTPPERMNP